MENKPKKCPTCGRSSVVFIKETLPVTRAYAMWFARLEWLKNSTIADDFDSREIASGNSMNLGFMLFPILESICINLLGKNNTRDYFKELGYTGVEADLINLIFRNGLLHSGNPKTLVYDDGKIVWGLMSTSGSGGFMPYDPGYTNKDDPSYNLPGERAFSYEKIGKIFHASLSLDRLVAHVEYDLKQRQSTETRKIIQFVVGQRMDGNLPQVGSRE